jgi:rod shape-determining protein RodA
MSRIWQRVTRVPVALLIAVLLLCAVGLLCIHVDAPRKAFMQAIWIVIGLGAFVVAIVVPYRRFGEASYVLFAVSLLMLVAILFLPTSIAPVIKGARRWFRVGPVQFQPSELTKIAFILALAWYLQYRKNYRSLTGLLWPFLLTLVPMGLILVEPDLGTSLLFLPALFAMLFMAGAKAKHLLAIALLGVLCMPAFWPVLKDHQKTRIRVWITQGQADDPQLRDKGYQLRESLQAVGSGRLTGQGYDQAIYARYDLLPEDNTDFIFSLIGNQWGFLGCLAVLAAYLVIFLYGIEIAAVSVDPFGRLLAVGVVALFAAQMTINVGMALGLLPITGMTLPFVSYGGSSILINFAALGLLVNVNLHRRLDLGRRRFQWDEQEGKLT